jgi:hypothetical protein
MDEKRLIEFTEKTKIFDPRVKLKIILFALGLKRSTFATLKNITRTGKHVFEESLYEAKKEYFVDSPRPFEEIKHVRKNTIRWKIAGQWVGYDLFQSTKDREIFEKYIMAVREGRHSQAHQLAATLYGYPSCCMKRFVAEENIEFLKKNYSYGQYFKRRRDLQLKFPFVQHTPCSTSCKRTAALNKKYAAAIKKNAREFYKDFTTKRKIQCKLVMDSTIDIFDDTGRPIWLEKDAHHCHAVSTTKIGGKFYRFTHLQNNFLEKGTIADAEIVIQYEYPSIKIKKISGFLPDLHHLRTLS